MKSTELFKTAIQKKLFALAETDPLFATTLQKEGKSIEDCVTYILNTVQQSGCNGFADEEIYGMAVHYYDEDSIVVGSKIDCQVVVNHAIELSAEEIQQARTLAKEKLINSEISRMSKKRGSEPASEKIVIQTSMF